MESSDYTKLLTLWSNPACDMLEWHTSVQEVLADDHRYQNFISAVETNNDLYGRGFYAYLLSNGIGYDIDRDTAFKLLEHEDIQDLPVSVRAILGVLMCDRNDDDQLAKGEQLIRSAAYDGSKYALRVLSEIVTDDDPDSMTKCSKDMVIIKYTKVSKIESLYHTYQSDIYFELLATADRFKAGEVYGIFPLVKQILAFPLPLNADKRGLAAMCLRMLSSFDKILAENNSLQSEFKHLHIELVEDYTKYRDVPRILERKRDPFNIYDADFPQYPLMEEIYAQALKQ